ncbi:hypothetical protein ACQKQC_16155 [Vibrio fortis]|uniref:hypothetical protein n=1 Tax=Vibrio fortis TaxID=212667 RepID=UPI0040679AA6
MIKKITLLITLFACGAGTSVASQLTLNQLENFDVGSFVYQQDKIPSKLYKGVPHYSMNSDSEDGLNASLLYRKTDNLVSALAYIDSINTVSPLWRQVMGAYIKVSALVMQNAEDSKYLLENSTLVSNVAQCLYFGIDEEVKFHINKGLNLLVVDEIDRERFIAGMARTVQLTPFQTNQTKLRDLIMSCSESTKL